MSQVSTQSRSVEEREEPLNIAALLDVLLQNKNLIMSFALALTILSGLYAFLAKPIYQADFMVEVEDSPDSAAAQSLLGNVSSLFAVKSSASAETQIISSRLVVSRAVDNLRLYIKANPNTLPVIGAWISRRNSEISDPGLFGVGGYTWGAESIDVDHFDVPASLEGEKYVLSYLGNDQYQIDGKGLDSPARGVVGKLATINTSYGVMTLFVKSIVGKTRASYVLERDSRLQTIDDLQKALSVSEKVKQSGILIASLEDTNPELVKEIMTEIANEYIQQNVDRKSADAAQSLMFLNNQLPTLKKKLEDSEKIYTALRSKLGTVDLPEEAKLALGQAADTQAKILELQQKKEELSTRFNPSHPGMLALNEQIATLRAKGGDFNQVIRNLPDVGQDVARAAFDVKVNSDLYTALLTSFQQLELVRAGKTGTVRLVDSPVVPEKPVKPKKLMVVAAGLMFGLLLGITVSFLRNILFKGITEASDIEERTGLDVLATIPLSKRQLELSSHMRSHSQQIQVLASVAPNDPAIESVRSLRTAVQFALGQSTRNIVLITGPSPSIGKSFVSANYAAMAAASGKKILLIDGDIRKGYLHQYFGLTRGKGLAEIVKGEISFESVIHRNALENLDFISTGKLPSQPAELLLNGKMAPFLEEMSSRYDIVVMDTAPILAATDTEIVAGLAGFVLLVAGFDKTHLGDIQESVKRLSKAGVQANAVVINGVDPNYGRLAYGGKYQAYRYVNYGYSPQVSDDD